MKKGILKILGGMVILIIMLNTIVIAVNDTAGLQNNKNSNDKKINEAQSGLKEVQAEKTETVKQVENLSSQISDYEKQIADLDNQITEKNILIEETGNKILQKEKDFSSQEKLLNERLIATYEAGDTSYLDVLLSSESVTDLISNYYLVTEVATYDAELLEKINKEKKEIEEAKQQLETSKSELDTIKSSKKSVTTQLQESKNQKNTYAAQLTQKERDIQGEIDDLKAANIQIDKDIQNAQARYAKQIEELENNTGGGKNPSSGDDDQGGSSSAGFIQPVNSHVTTGLYYSDGRYHGGVDFGAPGINGMPIRAVADGIVTLTVAGTTSYGNYIIIAHANGLYTLYAHGQMGSISVSPGQRVSQGKQIMKVGNTGNSSGPHLHFEVRTSPGGYNNRVDPSRYLP